MQSTIGFTRQETDIRSFPQPLLEERGAEFSIIGVVMG
jgi:hypothetical protein